MKPVKQHSVIFEHQWPRLMEVNKRRIKAHSETANRGRYAGTGDKPPLFFGRKKWQRWVDHLNKINAHMDWMIMHECGDTICGWTSMYVNFPRRYEVSGSGFRNQVLMFILVASTEEDEK